MGRTRYFAFFGEVEIPEQEELHEALKTIVKAFEAEEFSRYDESDPLPDTSEIQRKAMVNAYHALRQLLGGEDHYLGRDQSLTARALELPNGNAVLLLNCPDGGWGMIGAVKWPLRFTKPAQIPGGVCGCFPRYGLK